MGWEDRGVSGAEEERDRSEWLLEMGWAQPVWGI